MIVPVPKASARLTTQYLPILVSLTTFIAALDLAEIEHTFVPQRDHVVAWAGQSFARNGLGHVEHSDRTAADTRVRGRSPQLHQGCAIPRRHSAGGQRADQKAAISSRLRASRQERARREPDATGRDARHPRTPDAVDQRSDRAAQRPPADGADAARRHPRRFRRREDSGDLGAVSQALAGYPLHRERDELRKHVARAAARRRRSRGGNRKLEAVDRGASFVDRPGGVGA